MPIVLNDTSPISIYISDPTDATGRTPKTGLTGIVMKLGKAGGAGVTSTGTIVEQDAANLPGFYKWTPVTADVGTLGELVMVASVAGGDVWRDKDRVVQAGPTAADYTSARAGKLDTADAASVLTAAAAAPIAAELKKVNGTPLGTHAGTTLDPFGP